MQLGIKIGPENWKDRLEQSRAKLCEVWFRVDWEEKYHEMFSYLKKNEIRTGLHFWGVCKNDIFPSLLTKNKKVREESMNLIKKTIEIAEKHDFCYVNVHPEARKLFRLIFPIGEIKILDEITSINEGKKHLLESAKELTEFRKKKNILLIIESGTRLVSDKWWGVPKRIPVDYKTVPSSWLEILGEKGIAINVDIGHLLTESKSQNPKVLVKKLKEKTKRLAPFTKLLHVSTLIPPFNGTDSHNGFTKEDYQKGAIPDLENLKDILRIFKNREDLLIIPEPDSSHVENYEILNQIIKTL